MSDGRRASGPRGRHALARTMAKLPIQLLEVLKYAKLSLTYGQHEEGQIQLGLVNPALLFDGSTWL